MLRRNQYGKYVPHGMFTVRPRDKAERGEARTQTRNGQRKALGQPMVELKEVLDLPEYGTEKEKE